MPLLAQEELRLLTETRPGPCVSMYLPTHRAAPEKRQNPTELKHLVRRAEEQLRALGLRRAQLAGMLRAARALIENPKAWERPGYGLALFLAPDFAREYHLPLPLAPLVVVGARFHLKPLLPAFAESEAFFLLALSQHEVRLFSGTSLTIAEVDLGDTPRNLAEALRYDTMENQVTFHTTVRSGGATGRSGAMFHGHADVGAGPDRDILLFFKQVDAGVRRAIGEQTAPLILAGVEYERASYRRANTYSHLVEEGVEGNPKLLSPAQLQARARPIAERVYEGRMQAERERFQSLAATGGRASNDTKTIVPAAHEGRVERLWVSRTANAWGRFDPDTGEVRLCARPEAGCDDLLDLATIETLVGSGRVYVVEQKHVPQNSQAAAIFRY